MSRTKCDVCGGEMKPLFSTLFCPDEDKPDHGKTSTRAYAERFLLGNLSLDEFEAIWKKANGYVN